MPFFSEQLAASAATVLREALAASAGKHALASSVLERGGRSHDEWLAALRTFGRGATERYRELATTADALRELIASPSAPAHARVAAAVALAEAQGASAGAEIRRLAARTADVRVERGLLRIADAASDEELARALEEVESAEGQKRIGLTSRV